MKNVLIILGFLLASVLVSCSGKSTDEEAGKGLNKVTVKEVLQANKYTYLQVEGDQTSKWLAVPKMEAKIGEVMYYATGFEMKNFESKDLQRTFEEILFVELISTDPKAFENPVSVGQSAAAPGNDASTGGQSVVDITPVEGGMGIAELFAKKKEMGGKKILVKGKVIKANTGILGTNWYHISDGNKDGKPTDLTVTSDAFLNVGDVAVFEGVVVLDKDLGSGYFFEVLLEKASVK